MLFVTFVLSVAPFIVLDCKLRINIELFNPILVNIKYHLV